MQTTVAPTAQRVTGQVARLKAREAAAWGELFEQEYPLVYRTVLSRTGNPAAAEDVASQVFVEAIEGIGRFQDRGRPVGAWLMVIARHRVADWFRRQQRERGTAIEPQTDGPEAGLTVALEALQVLTPEQREVVHLRFVEGFPLEDVALRTGRSVGAVKALQHRAITRLRGVIGEQGRVS